MKYISHTLETVAILCVTPFIFAFALIRFALTALVMVATRILNVWVE